MNNEILREILKRLDSDSCIHSDTTRRVKSHILAVIADKKLLKENSK